MKFLCPNCKAKYQISDEKIAGRTLKMDCRRCNHPIVIRGDKAAGGSKGSGRSSRPAPGAGRRRGGSGVGPAPSRSSRTALGADFRKNPGPAAPAQKTTALDQWYVAINDVPVGPMKRGEIANKIAAGAIDGGSLSWREGFDDWRELKNIPELAALLQKARPAPPKPAFPSPGRGLGGRAPARPARPPSSRNQAPRPTGGAEASRPAARGNVVPIGGRLGAAAAPALDELPQNDFDDEPTRVGAAIDFEAMEREAREEAEREAREAEAAAAEEEEEQKKPVGVAFGGDSDVFDPFASQAGAAAVGSSPGVASSPGAASSPGFAPAPAGFEAAPASPPPAAVPVERRRRAIPIGAWIAIAGAMAFGVALAVMVGTHLLQQPPAPEVATAEPTAPAEPQEPNAPTLDTEVPEEPAEPTEEESAAAEEGDAEEPEEASEPTPRRGTTNNQGTSRTQRGGGSSGSGSSGSGSSGSGSSGGSAAPRPDPRFDRFADDGAGVATIGQRPSSVLDERRETGGGTLNADQIRTVVNRERSAVTRCYETAARQSGRAPSVRVDVDVTVGGSGTVTRARARGQAFGNLHECIERSVRRWRFPASGGQTQTSIPFVFQGRD